MADRRRWVAAAGLVGVFGVISISGTRVVGPDAGEPTFPTVESVGPTTTPTIAYTDCYFDSSQSNEVIENRVIDCDASFGLRFESGVTGIVFRDSIIRGQMFVLSSAPGDTGADTYPRTPTFTVEDSTIVQSVGDDGIQDRAACCSHYVIKRSYIQGTHSVLAAHNNVVLEGNYITTDGSATHQSGLRMLKNSVLDNNTITCKPVSASPNAYDGSGCSAHAVFYREDLGGGNVPAYNLTITDNYFKRGTTSGGVAAGPYYATRFVNCADFTDCTGITFTGNQFSLGEGTDGGEFPDYGGNVWADNVWTDGQPALSGQSR